MAEDTDPSSKTILTVDDDDTVQELMRMLLTREGFRVQTATSGAAALERLKTSGRQIDLVVLDMMMPNEGGYETIKKMQQPEYQQVPVIVVTAREMDSGTVNMIKLESNVKGYEKKPVVPKIFAEKIHGILGTTPKPKAKDVWEDGR